MKKLKRLCFKLHKWSCLLLSKVEARQKLFAARATISATDRQLAGQAAAKRFSNHFLFEQNNRIACYLSQKNEFDTTSIIEAIWNMGKTCYLPVLTADNLLQFAKYDPHTTLRFNRYQIQEPVDASLVSPEELDLVIMPLVGFDLLGRRLGMGGGYYDKTFSFLQDKQLTKPFLLGLGSEVQKLEELPVDAWDVLLHGVLTEQTIYLF